MAFSRSTQDRKLFSDALIGARSGRLKAALTEQGRGDVIIVIGGVIPPGDYDALYAAGASALFPPGTVIVEAAVRLIEELNGRLGYVARSAAE